MDVRAEQPQKMRPAQIKAEAEANANATAEDFAAKATKRAVYGSFYPGTKILGIKIVETPGLAGAHRHSLEGLGPTPELTLVRRVVERAKKYDDTLKGMVDINTRFVSITPAPKEEKARDKVVLTIHFFQDREHPTQAYASTLLPLGIANGLIGRIKTNPDFLEEFYQAAFPDVEMPRVAANGFYILGHNELSRLPHEFNEIDDKSQPSFRALFINPNAPQSALQKYMYSK